MSCGAEPARLDLSRTSSAPRESRAGSERRAITTDTALRLGRYFKTTPVFWMNLQVRYDLEVAEDEQAEKIARDVQPMEVASI